MPSALEPQLPLRSVPAYRLRLAVVGAAALLCLTATAWVFWAQDWRYAQPTPVPIGLPQVQPGTRLDPGAIMPELAGPANNDRTTLLHFFNAECPCSRFNTEHIASLRATFGGQVRFVIVAQMEASDPADRERTMRKVRRDFPGAEVVADWGGAVAKRCGVYSTPQAVILAPGGELLYRGNYNVSRYCVDAATEFARLVLTQTLAGHRVPALPQEATVAYGCELPSNRGTFRLTNLSRN